MKWFKTEEILPNNHDGIDNRGWVLGRFSRIKFSTVRYIESHSRWQNWDYSWCHNYPREWMYIPNELVSEWDMLYGLPFLDSEESGETH